MASWSDVERLIRMLPGVTQPKRREWRVADKLVAWERPLRPSDHRALGAEAPTGPILAVYAPLDIKEVLLAARSEVYFTTPHFDGWPAILIRLPAIRASDLRDRLRRAWLARAPKRLVAGGDRLDYGVPSSAAPETIAAGGASPRAPKGESMATPRQRSAARRNIRKAATAARRKRTISKLPKRVRTALGKQGAKVAKRRRRR